MYIRRPAGEKTREWQTKLPGEELGSPRITGLHKTISIGSSGIPEVELHKTLDSDYEGILTKYVRLFWHCLYPDILPQELIHINMYSRNPTVQNEYSRTSFWIAQHQYHQQKK